MKIVHSLWSKPSFQGNSTAVFDRSTGGWLNRKYLLMSWTFSCLQAKKYYDRVELVTDQFGAELLVNQLNLPYTSLKVELDQLNDYHTSLWALGKIYAYQLQQEPFIHIDSDVYIWSRFREEIEQATLNAQHEEKGYEMYNEILRWLDDFDYLPEVFIKDQREDAIIVAANAGIMGGNDPTFFQELWQEVKTFLDRNHSKIDTIRTGFLNVLYEQYLFARLAKERAIPITYLFDEVSPAYNQLREFYSVPYRSKYIHLVGTMKQQLKDCEWLAFQLRSTYPEYYYKIQNLTDAFKV